MKVVPSLEELKAGIKRIMEVDEGIHIVDQVPTLLKVGMEINTLPTPGNILRVVSVEGNIAKIKVISLNDLHAQGAARPYGYFSSYWKAGKIYTLRRYDCFPTTDYWYFEDDELERHDSVLTVLLEETSSGTLRVIVDMDT